MLRGFCETKRLVFLTHNGGARADYFCHSLLSAITCIFNFRNVIALKRPPLEFRTVEFAIFWLKKTKYRILQLSLASTVLIYQNIVTEFYNSHLLSTLGFSGLKSFQLF